MLIFFHSSLYHERSYICAGNRNEYQTQDDHHLALACSRRRGRIRIDRKCSDIQCVHFISSFGGRLEVADDLIGAAVKRFKVSALQIDFDRTGGKIIINAFLFPIVRKSANQLFLVFVHDFYPHKLIKYCTVILKR